MFSSLVRFSFFFFFSFTYKLGLFMRRPCWNNNARTRNVQNSSVSTRAYDNVTLEFKTLYVYALRRLRRVRTTYYPPPPIESSTYRFSWLAALIRTRPVIVTQLLLRCARVRLSTFGTMTSAACLYAGTCLRRKVWAMHFDINYQQKLFKTWEIVF